MNLIEKFGLIIIREQKILLCRPFAFPDLITVGGIKEGDEGYVENLTREVREELGPEAQIDFNSLKFLGKFTDRAAGKTERMVTIDLYLGNISGALCASSEIKELVWYEAGLEGWTLSPIVKNKIIPFLVQSGYLNWNLA